VPAIQLYIIKPIWEQFRALLPERKTDHPLGCHRQRIPERVVFEKLVEITQRPQEAFVVHGEGGSSTFGWRSRMS
jgi:hypothetical protein